jgi:hypothetical protein
MIMQRVIAKIEKITKVSEKRDELGILWRSLRIKARVSKPALKGFRLPKRSKGRILEVTMDIPEFRRLRVRDTIQIDRETIAKWLAPLDISPPILGSSGGKARAVLRFHGKGASPLRWTVNTKKERLSGGLDESGTAVIDLNLAKYGTGLHGANIRCGAEELRAYFPRPGARQVFTYSADVDRDGFPERILENAFLRCAVSPHLGGRVLQLVNRSTGVDFFPIPELFGSGGYVEYPGIDDHIQRKGPGSLYNAEFKVGKEHHGKLVLNHKAKDLRIEKTFRMLPGLPLVVERVELTTSKKKREIEYWKKVPVRADIGSGEVFLSAPTAEKVETFRHHDPSGPWAWTEEFHVGPMGLALACREAVGKHLFVLYDPGRMSEMKMRISPYLHTLEIHKNNYELKKNKTLKLGFLHALGEASVVGKKYAFLLSQSPQRGRGRSVCLIGRALTETPAEVEFRTNKEVVTAPLRKRKIPRVGMIFHATAVIRAEPDEPIETHFTIAGRRRKIRTGAPSCSSH